MQTFFDCKKFFVLIAKNVAHNICIWVLFELNMVCTVLTLTWERTLPTGKTNPCHNERHQNFHRFRSFSLIGYRYMVQYILWIKWKKPKMSTNSISWRIYKLCNSLWWSLYDRLMIILWSFISTLAILLKRRLYTPPFLQQFFAFDFRQKHCCIYSILHKNLEIDVIHRCLSKNSLYILM